MATKAQRFRAQQQRDAHPPRAPSPPAPRRDVPVDTSRPGVSASDRKVGALSSAARNRSDRAGRKGGARLEDSRDGTPSRKSTRRSTGRVKRTNSLRQRQVRRNSAPAARAMRAGVRR